MIELYDHRPSLLQKVCLVHEQERLHAVWLHCRLGTGVGM
jgi:hypothetical protein